MATWRKALVLGLAVVVGAVPVLARVDLGLQAAAPVVQQPSVPLPQGDEMGDDELLQAEGELGFIAAVIIAFCVGAGWAAYEEYYHDEDRGVDWDDAPRIAGAGAVCALLMGIGLR